MARLLSWVSGLGITAYQRLGGPETVGETSSESINGFVQTVATAFGSWRYQLSLQAMRGRKYRLYRGMVTGLNGAANALRVPFYDPDEPDWDEAGVTISESQKTNGLPFSNGKPFSNGMNWQASKPPVGVAVDAALGATAITLADEHWGRNRMGGEWIGFFPFHFGKYEITEVIDADAGQYRIWPPLRKALTAGATYCTLYPIMAMRLENKAGGTVQRGVAVAESATLSLVEVRDYDVRDYFAD